MMRRGEIRMVSLDPVRGAQSDRTRLGVIVSNDGANNAATRLARGVVTVVPVTTNVARCYPFQVPLSAGDCGLTTDSKAQAEQVRSVPVERIGRKVGQVPGALMEKVDQALRVHLGLS